MTTQNGMLESETCEHCRTNYISSPRAAGGGCGWYKTHRGYERGECGTSACPQQGNGGSLRAARLARMREIVAEMTARMSRREGLNG